MKPSEFFWNILYVVAETMEGGKKVNHVVRVSSS